MEGEKRQTEFDVLRLMATIAVIMTHVCGSEIHDISVTSSDFVWLNIIRAAITWDVPIFVMISGRFFLDSKRDLSIKVLYQKYIKRLIISFAIWSALYSVYYVTSTRSIGLGNAPIEYKKYIFEFLTGPYHMWYIFMLVALYIVSPILRKIAENKTIMEYFIILFLISQFIQQYMIKMPGIGNIVNTIWGKTYFYMTLGYTGYFVLGFYLYRYGIPQKMEKILYIITVVLICFSCVGTTIQSVEKGALDEFISTYQTPNVIIESCGIYLFVIKRKVGRNFKSGIKSILEKLGRWGLGIYLSHALMLEIISISGITAIFIHPIIGVLLMTACVFAMSVFIVYILQKVPVLRKYMI